MKAMGMASWPAVRDVTRQLGISQPRVSQLMRAGRLRGVKTRLGWLVDPRSVAAFEAERLERLERRHQRSA